MRKQVQELADHALVDFGPSAWASPGFLVAKPRSTKLRLVIDYRLVNRQTQRDSFLIPNTRDVL